MYQQRYERRKEELLKDKSINPKNKEIIEKFLEWEEYKLKRKEGLSEVDERSYKTLYFYIGRIININKWFKNKSWKDLTKEDIKKIIDDLEDGKIVNRYGKRYSDRSQFYQMFQNKFFGLAGKNHISRDILEEFSIKGRRDTNHVRFVEEEGFRKIVDCTSTPEQKALCWLAWDIGENIGSLILLEKEDLKRQINPDTNEPEYLVILPKSKLKRSRTPRSELTNYPETVKYLDIVLENLKPADKNFTNKFVKNKNINSIHSPNKLFKFGWKVAEKFFRKAVEKSGVRCMPEGERPTWKDLRSGMACHLLRGGGETGSSWTIEEISARLGHKPSSRFVIDKYVSYLAINKRKPQQKVYQGNLKKLETDLEKQKELNKLQQMRIENLKNEQEQIKNELRLFMKNSKDNLLGSLENLEEAKKEIIEVKI
jgi:integrase